MRKKIGEEITFRSLFFSYIIIYQYDVASSSLPSLTQHITQRLYIDAFCSRYADTLECFRGKGHEPDARGRYIVAKGDIHVCEFFCAVSADRIAQHTVVDAIAIHECQEFKRVTTAS